MHQQSQHPPPETPAPGADKTRFLSTNTRIALAALLLLVLWLAADVLLMLFAAVLLATALRGLSMLVSDRTPLSPGWALLLIIVAGIALVGGGGWFIAPGVAEQSQELWEQLTDFGGRLVRFVRQYLPGTDALDQEAPNEMAREAAARFANAVTATVGALTTLAIIFLIGVYLAATPDRYRAGLVRLVPVRHRARAEEVLDAVAYALQWWLLGQLVSMITLGTLTGLALWLLGVPLWLTLALLTAMLTFVPYLGPIIAAVPVVLVAFAEGPATALYVFVLYLAIQSFESYFVTPMVQQQAVYLPPALTIAVQILLGALFGIPGLILATPLAAVGLVLVRMLYVEDMLGDTADSGGNNGDRSESPRKGASASA
jgi:predicted PurR-regulated permease PerM